MQLGHGATAQARAGATTLPHSLRIPFSPGALCGALVLSALVAGCSPTRRDEGMTEEMHSQTRVEHESAMANVGAGQVAPDGEAAGTQPAILPASEVTRRIGADAGLAARLRAPLAGLNAALADLVALHRRADAEPRPADRQELDSLVYSLHMKADTYENTIHTLLSEDQFRRFHAYLEKRVTAGGVPRDGAHGAGLGTAGSPHSISHPAGQQHTTGSPVPETIPQRRP